MKGWEDVTEEDILKLSYRKNIKPIGDRKTVAGKTTSKNKYNAVKTEINGIKFDSKDGLTINGYLKVPIILKITIRN